MEKKYFLSLADLSRLPGILDVLVGHDQAVILYRSGKRMRITAPDRETLLGLLNSWLVPLDVSAEFDTLSNYSAALHRADSPTFIQGVS
jgi:hypothetical protein